MLLLIKKCYEEYSKKNQKSGYYLTYNKLLVQDVKFIINEYQEKKIFENHYKNLT